MKRTQVAIVSAVLGLWLGYCLGYHHGQQGELAAWRAAQMVELETENGQVVATAKWSPPTREGVRERVPVSKAHFSRVYYEDPHAKARVVLRPRRAENMPDPRNMLVDP
jgi:hypothetical protein